MTLVSNWMKQFEWAAASSAAASFSCANLFVMDAVLLASIIFILSVLDLHILGILVVLISILRIIVCKSHQPESLA